MKASKFKGLVLAIVALSSSMLAIAQDPMASLPIDTGVRVGQLENGLTYFIRRNKHPEGRAHFYISQRVGSMQEEESQRGLAHFLEHMAFNGTKNFPGKTMINWLESIGIKFGANLNAYTGFDETVYQIMGAPTARQSVVDSCLLILHDWSNAISLEEKEIDNERGVIHEEWRQRDNGNMRVMAKMLEDAFPTSLYGQRMPIGLMEVVRNFKYDELRAYYKKWYRPDLQALIIVGDIDPDKVEASIKRQFADVPKPINAAPRIYETVEPQPGVWASIATDKEAVGTNISINFLSEALPREARGSIISLVQNYIRSIVGFVVNERFSDMVKKPKAPFISAGAGINSFIVAQSKDAFNFTATAADGAYKPALTALVAEIERLAQYGLNKSEYERAKTNYFVSLKKAYDERATRKNGEYAEEYSAYFTQGGYIPGIEFEYNTLKMLSEQLPLQAINETIKQALSREEDDIFISLTGPAKEGLVYPTKEIFIAEFKDARKQKVAPLKEQVSSTKLMEVSPKAGKIIKEQEGKFGSKVWTLSNGVEVIIKPTTFKEDEISFSAQRRGGTFTFDKKDELEGRVINSIAHIGGLAQFDDSTLDKVLTGRWASASTSIGNTSESASGSSNKADLEIMMQLLYLNFTQKRSDKEAYSAWLEKAIEMKRMGESNPMSSLSDSVAKAIFPNDPTALSLTEAQYKAINYERAMELFRRRFANANGFKFVFVGNIDLPTFRPLVETYIASLPSSKNIRQPDLSRFPVARKGVYQKHYTKPLETPMGFVFNLYHGKLPANHRNRIVMNILKDILDQVYVETIREREGGTYGATTSTSLSYEPKDDASLQVIFQTDPSKAKHLNKIVNDELERIVKEGVDQVKFDKVIANYEKSYTERQKENGFWQGQLMTYYYHGRDGFTGYLDLLKSIKPSDVSALLAQLLAQKNSVELMMLPE